MKSICSFFDKVYCINLEERKDRWILCEEKFKEYGITNYERFNGVKVEGNLSPKKLGQIGCTASFYNVFKDAFQNNYNKILVLEDDFNFVVSKDEIINNLEKAFEEMPEDWDMLFIGSGCDLHIDQNLITDNKHIYKSKYSRCTDSYIVSKKCAKSILNYINNINYKIYEPIDTWLNRVNEDIKLNVFWAEPTIVFQGSQKGVFSSCIR
jgi:GR25 family glycosyltransferase involved in LPS biosynthesis